jgi:hypothetical protein
MREEQMRPGPLMQQCVGESDASFEKRAEEAMRDAMEFSATPDQCIPPPDTAEALLELARTLIKDNLLTPAQLSVLQESPSDFLRSLVADPLSAEAFNMVAEIKDALAKGYFQSLLAKAVEGEKYDEARLKQALLKARLKAVEKLEGFLESAHSLEAIRIAECLKN